MIFPGNALTNAAEFEAIRSEPSEIAVTMRSSYPT